MVENNRRCPECGSEVTERGRGIRKDFCCRKHRAAFHNRMKGGAAVVLWVKLWQRYRHSEKGSRAHRLAMLAMSEFTKIAAELNARDKKSGRPELLDYAEDLLAGSQYQDRSRK